ncbi:MAG: metallophosphatase family protein [Defluviitaleaceae bacterium]|nr:metallophosphatase family protein [Defluviitaleaceae bacterium]
MKYAIISDIHGNYHAFKAVLEDAKAQRADMYLLLGDYANSFPYGNDVAEEIRKLKPAVVIGGNGEGYYTNLLSRDPKEFTDEQFKPVYWGYRSLSKENLEYLVSLPEAVVVADGDTNIHLTHSMGLFFRTPQIEYFHSVHMPAIMEAVSFSREEYLTQARAALLDCPEALAEINAMPMGIYLFGHNHVQFHMEYEGRLFINPGSCGEPLDLDARASYTILTVDGADWAVTERRVKYDSNLVVEGLTTSGYGAYAPVWSEIMMLELLTARDYFYPFAVHVAEIGRKMGETQIPVSNAAWEAAVATWDMPIL